MYQHLLLSSKYIRVRDAPVTGGIGGTGGRWTGGTGGRWPVDRWDRWPMAGGPVGPVDRWDRWPVDRWPVAGGPVARGRWTGGRWHRSVMVVFVDDARCLNASMPILYCTHKSSMPILYGYPQIFKGYPTEVPIDPQCLYYRGTYRSSRPIL